MAVIDAKHGWRPDVQAAVDKAVPGDIVEIPSGQFDWSGSLMVPQGIWLKGDQTVWRKTDKLSEWQAMVIVDAAPTDQPFQMSGITLRGRLQDLQGDNRTEVLTEVRDQGLFVRGGAKVMVHDCHFTKFTRAGIEFDGSSGPHPGPLSGVIWGCSFVDIWYSYLGYGVSFSGHESTWTGPLSWGSLDAVFIEDCDFDRCRHFVASGNSSSYVARYNHCVDNYQDAAAFDAHGLSGAWPRGTRVTEIYCNNLNNSIRRNAGAGIRGGAGVIWGNNWNAGGAGVSIGVELMLEDPGQEKPELTSYPALDQIGNPDGLYIWENLGGTQPLALRACSHTSQPIDYWLQEGRDYHLVAPAGYVPAPYPHPWRD